MLLYLIIAILLYGGEEVVKCTFIGTRQYDLDLYGKIQAAVKKVLSKGEETEFLFYQTTGEFHALCFAALLEAKPRYPNKKVTAALVGRQGVKEGIPSFLFDKTIPAAPGTESVRQSARRWKQTAREIIRGADYVIACCYPELRGREYELLRYAAHQRGVSVLNLLDAQTTEFLRKQIESLPSVERSIVEAVDAGCSYSALARTMGISAAAVRARDGRSRRRLRACAVERMEGRRMERGPAAPLVCSIILPGRRGGELEEQKNRLRQAMGFLVRRLDVSTFLVEQSNCPMWGFSQPHEGGMRVELVVVTHYTLRDEVDWDAVRRRYLPPFTDLMNIDPETNIRWVRYLRTVKAMLARSAFVICNVAGASPCDGRIRRCIERRRGIKILDIGRPQDIARPTA